MSDLHRLASLWSQPRAVVTCGRPDIGVGPAAIMFGSTDGGCASARVLDGCQRIGKSGVGAGTSSLDIGFASESVATNDRLEQTVRRDPALCQRCEKQREQPHESNRRGNVTDEVIVGVYARYGTARNRSTLADFIQHDTFLALRNSGPALALFL
jgi:hypothetical protein